MIRLYMDFCKITGSITLTHKAMRHIASEGAGKTRVGREGAVVIVQQTQNAYGLYAAASVFFHPPLFFGTIK